MLTSEHDHGCAAVPARGYWCGGARTSLVSLPVRLIIGILLFVLGLGLGFWSGRQVVGLGDGRQAVGLDEGTWVRTAHGWERPQTWNAEAAKEPRLHPMVVAAGQGLASLLALLAWASPPVTSRQQLWELALRRA